MRPARVAATATGIANRNICAEPERHRFADDVAYGRLHRRDGRGAGDQLADFQARHRRVRREPGREGLGEAGVEQRPETGYSDTPTELAEHLRRRSGHPPGCGDGPAFWTTSMSTGIRIPMLKPSTTT